MCSKISGNAGGKPWPVIYYEPFLNISIYKRTFKSRTVSKTATDCSRLSGLFLTFFSAKFLLEDG